MLFAITWNHDAFGFLTSHCALNVRTLSLCYRHMRNLCACPKNDTMTSWNVPNVDNGQWMWELMWNSTPYRSSTEEDQTKLRAGRDKPYLRSGTTPTRPSARLWRALWLVQDSPGSREYRGSTKRGRRAVEALVRYELPADSRSWKGVVGRNPREIRSEIGGKTRSWVKGVRLEVGRNVFNYHELSECYVLNI